MGWQWHQLDHMQIICTSLQTDNHTSTSPLSFHRPDALPATQPTASKHWRHKHWRQVGRWPSKIFPLPTCWVTTRHLLVCVRCDCMRRRVLAQTSQQQWRRWRRFRRVQLIAVSVSATPSWLRCADCISRRTSRILFRHPVTTHSPYCRGSHFPRHVTQPP